MMSNPKNRSGVAFNCIQRFMLNLYTYAITPGVTRTKQMKQRPLWRGVYLSCEDGYINVTESTCQRSSFCPGGSVLASRLTSKAY